MDEVVKSSFQVMGSRTPIKPSQLNLLKKGDHIGWHRHFGHWHHAIVHSIDSLKDAIVVIHFQKPSLKERCKILKEELNVYKQEGYLVRFDYPNDIKESNPPEVVLERAVEKIGEMGYNVFKNNCEHFATFCKTGRKICAQVVWAIGKLKETAMTSVPNIVRSGVSLAPSMIKDLAKRGISCVLKVGGSEIVEFISRRSDLIGATMIAGIEVVHCAYDIKQMYKENLANKITNEDFNKEVTQRVTECVFGAGLAIGLGIAGGAFIGGAAAGCFIGSVIGGAVGSLGGKFGGRSLRNMLGGWFFG